MNALMLATLLLAQPANVEPPAGAPAPVVEEPGSPEAALRTFLKSMTLRDEPTLRAVTLPTEDFAWLMRSQPFPPNQVDGFKSYIASLPIKALAPGSEYAVPGGRMVQVGADEVGPDRVMLLPQGMPLPHRLRKVDGHWRVDASPIIAARKAAAARKQPARKPAQP